MNRRFLKIAVFLLLGAIVNVAVAWVIAWFLSGRTLQTLPLPETEAKELLTSSYPPFGGLQESRFRGENGNQFGRTYWHAELGPAGVPSVQCWMYGLPFRSLLGEVRHPGFYADSHWFWRVYRDEVTQSATHQLLVSLPLRPIWPGFAINTLFYAAILWMMFVIPGVLRRKRRLARGVCPACAYPIGSSPVCTECGKPLPKRELGQARGT